MNNEQLPIHPTFIDEMDELTLGLNKMEAFTMSAMQGLLANPEFLKKAGLNFQEHKNQSSEAIALTAINVARTTLFYLQNEQK